MKICELLIWTWETEIIMKHDMIWRIMQIEGSVILIIRQGCMNNLIQWQNQNITEIFSLTSTLYSSNSSCHQPSSHSFAILAMFFSLCKPRGLLFHFLQLYQNSRANTTLSPELFHYIGFFWWYPALLTSFYWISQTSLKLIDQWLAEYEELARKFVRSELEKYFE